MSRRSRRSFLGAAGKGLLGSAVVTGFPAIVPASVLGKSAPSRRINVGAIGVGRIARGHDLPGIWKYEEARIVGVCDVDAKRLEDAKVLVNKHYAETLGKAYDAVSSYSDYRELLANRDVDAVVISTPDHWHAIIAIDAVDEDAAQAVLGPRARAVPERR